MVNECVKSSELFHCIGLYLVLISCLAYCKTAILWLSSLIREGHDQRRVYYTGATNERLAGRYTEKQAVAGRPLPRAASVRINAVDEI